MQQYDHRADRVPNPVGFIGHIGYGDIGNYGWHFDDQPSPPSANKPEAVLLSAWPKIKNGAREMRHAPRMVQRVASALFGGDGTGRPNGTRLNHPI